MSDPAPLPVVPEGAHAAGGIAPPTVPGSLSVGTRPTIWPKAVGIISIVLGSLSVLGAILSSLQHAFMLMSFPGGQPGGSAPFDMSKIMQDTAVPQFLMQGVQFVLGVLLVVLGVMLLQRRPIARRGLFWWSVAKIFASFVTAGLVVWLQLRVSETMTETVASDPNAPAQMRTVFPALLLFSALFGGLFSLAWGCAWPTFLLIWLNRAPVRADVSSWRRAA